MRNSAFKMTRQLSFIALLAFHGLTHAWTLVYSHDQNGVSTFGNLQTLMTAANNGADVKVVADGGTQTIQFQCGWVHVRSGDATQSVVCTANSGLGVDITGGAPFGNITSPPHIGYYSMNTLGQYATTRINSGSANVSLRQTTSAALKWYVQ